jgi:hypothetical protein
MVANFFERRTLLLFVFGLMVIGVNGQALPTLIPCLDGKKWGYADSNGVMVIKAQWRHVGFFKNGRAEVYTEDSHCVIDTNGEYIIPPYRHWNGKFYSSVKQGGAYFNAKGKNGKRGIIDSNNRELLPCLYDDGEPGNGFTNSGYFLWNKLQNKYLAKMRKNGKYGVIDTFYRTLIPFEYDGIDIEGYPWASDKYCVIKKGEKMGLIDWRNRIIIPAKYENIHLNAYNNNQIKLYKKNASIIVDTNGKVIWEVPGHYVEFPQDSLAVVMDSSRKYAVMNRRHEVLFTGDYLWIALRKDTIVVSKWIVDSNKKQVQHFKNIDLHTQKDISGWLTSAQWHNLPEPAKETPQPALNSKLSHLLGMWIQGKNMKEYRIGNILWSARGYANMPERLMSVRGIADGDSIAAYAAIIDANGNYVVQPQLTDNELTLVNTTDSLVMVARNVGPPSPPVDRYNSRLGSWRNMRNTPDKQYAVVDYKMNVIMPFQEYELAGAFYDKGIFYAIAKHDKSRWEHWSNFEGGGSYEAHDYTYFLVTADGKPADRIGKYKLHWYTDSTGNYKVNDRNRYRDKEDGFEGASTGYFMAEDSMGRRGIISIDGRVQMPAVSFKYNQFNPRGENVYLVNNELVRQRHYRNRFLLTDGDEKVDNGSGLVRGMPYLVDADNRVLLDSLSIENVSYMLETDKAPLYNVCLKRPDSRYYERDINFYMNNKGKGYYKNLPKDRRR